MDCRSPIFVRKTTPASPRSATNGRIRKVVRIFYWQWGFEASVAKALGQPVLLRVSEIPERIQVEEACCRLASISVAFLQTFFLRLIGAAQDNSSVPRQHRAVHVNGNDLVIDQRLIRRDIENGYVPLVVSHCFHASAVAWNF